MIKIFNVKCVMCNVLKVVLLFFALYITPYTLHRAYAQPVLSTELINNAKFYDGETVVYAGEVIGDIMVRGDFAWINVNDGDKAIGIWLSASLAKDIAYKGSYKSKGDWVEVTGTLQRACTQHGGDLDIHAQAIKKINSGRNIDEHLIPGKQRLAIILFIILCATWILRLLKRK